MRLSDIDRICIPVPLYHCFGMVLGNLACVTHGSAMIYPSEAFDPVAVLETVAGSVAPVSTACRPCSLASSTTRASRNSI